MVKTIKDIVENLKGHREETALQYRDDDNNIVEKTWDDTCKDIQKIKNWIISQKLENERLAILCHNDYPTLITFLAVVSTNNSAVMLDKNETTENLITNMESINCNKMFYSIECEKKASEINEISKEKIKIINNENLNIDNAINQDNVEINESTIATILFTSGTTGTQKAVPLTHKNIISNVISYLDSLNFDAMGCKVKAIIPLPLHHAYGLNITLAGIMILAPMFITHSFMDLKDDLAYFKPSILVITPAVIDFLVKVSSRKFSKLPSAKFVRNLVIRLFRRKILDTAGIGNSIKWVISGGGFLAEKHEKLFKLFGITIFNGYGITECSPVVACNTYNFSYPTSVGKILDCCEVKFSDQNEILIKGDNVFSGYLNVEDDDSIQNGWFNTRDVGHIGKHGELYITGRTKKLIILSNGENVPAEPLEFKVSQIPYVTEVVVRGIDDKITAEVYCEESDENTLDTLKADIAKINSKLPITHRITNIVLKEEEFEKTAIGKIKIKN